MANPDTFEHANNDSSDEANTTEQTWAKKHYEIAVPDFTETDAATHVGTSFLRIGSSFTSTEFTSGTTDLTTDHPILRAEKASLNLAKLVGDPAKIASTTANPAGVEDLAAETDGGENQFPGRDDSSKFMVGFADDTRYRSGDAAHAASTTTDNSELNTFVSGQSRLNTKANRQTETKKLLTKGGWWDHSDGNRITTTAGDKVEVIQGNYKMVVLGRQDPSQTLDMNRVLVTDISGGHFQEQYASPTPCIKTTEYASKGGIWTLYQDNGGGNVHTHYGWGTIVDTYEVETKKTQIGVWDNESKRTTIDDFAWLQSNTSKTDVSGDVQSNVKVGGKIDNYTKVDGLVQNNTVAGQITSLNTAKAITNTNTAANHFNMTVGIQENINVGPQMNFFLGVIFNLYASATLSVGANATSVNGTNNTYDGTKLTATLTDSKVRGLQTDLNNLGTILHNQVNNVAQNSMTIVQGTTTVANTIASLSTMTLL